MNLWISLAHFEVATIRPTQMKDVGRVIDLLRTGRSCLVILTQLDPDLRRRAADCLAGACLMLQTQSYQLTDGIFLFNVSSPELNSLISNLTVA